MGAVRRQIAGAAAVPADQPSCGIERRPAAANALVHETEALFHERGFAFAGGFLECLELDALLASEAGVHVALHGTQCSTCVICCATRSVEAQ